MPTSDVWAPSRGRWCAFSSLIPSQGRQTWRLSASSCGEYPLFPPGLPLPTLLPSICLVMIGESAILDASPSLAEEGLTSPHRNYLSHKK